MTTHSRIVCSCNKELEEILRKVAVVETQMKNDTKTAAEIIVLLIAKNFIYIQESFTWSSANYQIFKGNYEVYIEQCFCCDLFDEFSDLFETVLGVLFIFQTLFLWI